MAVHSLFKRSCLSTPKFVYLFYMSFSPQRPPGIAASYTLPTKEEARILSPLIARRLLKMQREKHPFVSTPDDERKAIQVPWRTHHKVKAICAQLGISMGAAVDIALASAFCSRENFSAMIYGYLRENNEPLDDLSPQAATPPETKTDPS